MRRSFVLAFWELRRILRSKPTLASLLTVPVIGIAANSGCRSLSIADLFPFAAIATGVFLMYVRHYADRHSGYLLGIESTPAAGTIAYTAKVIAGLSVAISLTVIFRAVTRFF